MLFVDPHFFPRVAKNVCRTFNIFNLFYSILHENMHLSSSLHFWDLNMRTH